MLTYLQSQLFPPTNNNNQPPLNNPDPNNNPNLPTSLLQSIQTILHDLQTDNLAISQQIAGYQQKISKLPAQIRRKILEQGGLLGGEGVVVEEEGGRERNFQQQEQEDGGEGRGKNKELYFDVADRVIHQSKMGSQQQDQQLGQQGQRSPSLSPTHHLFTSMLDKHTLQQRLSNLQQQQYQIDYIARLSDLYIRCKKEGQGKMESQEIEEIEEFVKGIRLYDQRGEQKQQEQLRQEQYKQRQEQWHQLQQEQQHLSPSTLLTNTLITSIRLHTSKKLTQKCQNLILCSTSSSTSKITIQKLLIKNCRSIILGQEFQQTHVMNEKNAKIINKFIERILGEVVYYDVSCQKVVLMEVVGKVENGEKEEKEVNQKKEGQRKEGNEKRHREVVRRRKVGFAPVETEKHFQQVRETLRFHVKKVDELKELLYPESHHPSSTFSTLFDKSVQKHLSQIKSTLQYILPFINIKSRKEIMVILTHGQGEIIEFQDLVLRLKFRGQDGDMFMGNLDAVFGRLVEMREKGDESDSMKKNGKESSEGQQEGQRKDPITFNQKNFQTLTNFFQLSIFQAQQSLLESSSKAIKKLTTNFTARNNFQKLPSSKHNSKKLFNMIFFSVSNLIERFDELLDNQNDLMQEWSKNLGQSFQDKVSEWVAKLIQIRESVRRRVHQE